MEKVLGDMHAHLCFGVDDGPQEETEVRRLVNLAAASGTTHLWVTPHVIEPSNAPAWQQILQQVDRLRNYVRDNGLQLELYPGAEVYMNPDLLEFLGADGAYCLNGGRYILVELPMDQMPNYADDFWYELRLRGLRPVIAHPERYGALAHNPELLHRWRKEGLVCQCNIGSFSGQFGNWARRAAIDLTKRGLVDLVGSDAHSIERRNTNMGAGLEVLRSLVSVEDFQRITHDNPLRILQNEELELPPMADLRSASIFSWRNFFGRMFRR